VPEGGGRCRPAEASHRRNIQEEARKARSNPLNLDLGFSLTQVQDCASGHGKMSLQKPHARNHYIDYTVKVRRSIHALLDGVIRAGRQSGGKGAAGREPAESGLAEASPPTPPTPHPVDTKRGRPVGHVLSGRIRGTRQALLPAVRMKRRRRIRRADGSRPADRRTKPPHRERLRLRQTPIGGSFVSRRFSSRTNEKDLQRRPAERRFPLFSGPPNGVKVFSKLAFPIP
jgi:hypothetical protein